MSHKSFRYVGSAPERKAPKKRKRRHEKKKERDPPAPVSEFPYGNEKIVEEFRPLQAYIDENCKQRRLLNEALQAFEGFQQMITEAQGGIRNARCMIQKADADEIMKDVEEEEAIKVEKEPEGKGKEKEEEKEQEKEITHEYHDDIRPAHFIDSLQVESSAELGLPSSQYFSAASDQHPMSEDPDLLLSLTRLSLKHTERMGAVLRRTKPTLLLCGANECGKSELFNAIIGRVISRVQKGACTLRSLRASFSPTERTTLAHLPSGERESIPNNKRDESQARPPGLRKEKYGAFMDTVVECGLPDQLLSFGIDVIDTPGLTENATVSDRVCRLLQEEPLVLFVFSDPNVAHKEVLALKQVLEVLKSSPLPFRIFFICNGVDDMAAKVNNDFDAPKRIFQRLSQVLTEMGRGGLLDGNDETCKNFACVSALETIAAYIDESSPPHSFRLFLSKLYDFIRDSITLEVDACANLLEGSVENLLHLVEQSRCSSEAEVLHLCEEAKANEQAVATRLTKAVSKAEQQFTTTVRNYLNSMDTRVINIDMSDFHRPLDSDLSRLKARKVFHERMCDEVARSLSEQIETALTRLRQRIQHIMKEVEEGKHRENVPFFLAWQSSYMAAFAKAEEQSAISKEVVNKRVRFDWWKAFWELNLTLLLSAPWLVVPIPRALLMPVSIEVGQHITDKLCVETVNKEWKRARMREFVSKAEIRASIFQREKDLLTHLHAMFNETLPCVAETLRRALGGFHTLGKKTKKFLWTQATQVKVHLETFQLARDGIDVDFLRNKGRELRKGAFGVVERYVWKGEDVAVKTVTPEHAALLCAEYKYYSAVAEYAKKNRIKKTYVLEPYACIAREGCIHLIMPWIPFTLRQVLSGKPLQFEQRLRILRQIAVGLQCLHGAHIMHRDLGSNNVLIDDEHDVYLCDLGISTWEEFANSGDIGTAAYMAPEVLLRKSGKEANYTSAVDVYSFSILLWEAYPRDTYVPPEDLVKRLGLVRFLKGVKNRNDPLRQQLPYADTSVGTQWVELIRDCWQHEPTSRPTIENIIKRIDDMLFDL